MEGAATKVIDPITLESEEGQQLLDEAEACQYILVDMFDFQAHSSHCGIQSAALLIASYECGKACRAAGYCSFRHCEDIKKQYHGFAMFNFKETQDIITHDVIKTRGTTLEDVTQILQNHKHEATAYLAQESSLDEFRQLAVEAVRQEDSSAGVIVNFQRYLLGQIGEVSQYGHHSPLCAYHKGSDRFLMLDTNVGKPKLWLKTEDLFQSMQDVDVATGKSRGFVIMGGVV
ncbi:glutathione gamma-glutamylcysteinyltransferase 1-like [Acanthaster planci]|uniref:glutathione gamma-glutamylcysteinyltransferase n=1 Tax=Acanthaster planci TaxID=133434 RepID=A0A8B7YX43_ACAPL|nr:glutathione gamma-glutamylcysteinyltransferase 1-like [Acanthaster planci]XP_022097053.1 glutathione gamma-glutamylcysteinyltransferase 1-like [Acanthaster planci]XP_022097054.1 glutathione gamma-glutamylcysteinyltransferase 1-like [Acanthaster planci]XP_022097055.1 glutathione gamma-glutamylcysteinyltransferase 1-like [Acanthaster planci]XP_022097056.1 glutathione gamma-glutamylcysteinyltransferase 1-like [Acanthaster planci]